MPENTPPKGQLPKRFLKFQQDHPALYRAYEQLGNAARNAGPLDNKTRELVRLAIAVGNRHEGAVHSHTRRALEAGATPEELRHVALLAVTSIGFPNMMAALSWVEDVLNA
jgi:4-carboxymuconolactone decarboxylase